MVSFSAACPPVSCSRRGPPLTHTSLFLLQVACILKTVFIHRGIIMLLQVLSGLSHALHALVDPLEEDHHGHVGFQGGFLSCNQINNQINQIAS